ncbi:GFA family protein [Halieaceae bacterium]|jgi:hypothetical protein|nr:GFA family protein [Halieaceae bacterium]
MEVTGGCYCGQVRYKATGEPLFRAQCHCRECQYITGGSANVLMGMPAAGFEFTKGEAKGFSRDDIENGVTRDFCPNCGTHLLTRAPQSAELLFLKVGSMDDPSQFGMPDMAIYTSEMQAFHTIPEGVKTFEKFSGS